MRFQNKAFSLVEMLITITLMGIIASMVVSYYSNVSQDSARVVARQQQATINSAVQQWIAGQKGSLGTIKGAYNGSGNKLTMLRPYLASHIYDHFTASGSSGSTISSEALTIAGSTITLPNWGAADDEPKIELAQ